MLADVSYLPFRSETLDFVVAIRVLKYAHDLVHVLEHVSRCLASKGVIIFEIVNGLSPQSVLSWVSRAFHLRTMWAFTTPLNVEKVHVLLRKLGLRELCCVGMWRIPHTIGFRLPRGVAQEIEGILSSLPAWMFSRNIYFVCLKDRTSQVPDFLF